MSCDQSRTSSERPKGFSKCGVAFLGRSIESIVCGELAGCLPNRLHGVELGRVGRQSKECDPPRALCEPALPLLVEVVAGAVVHDEEDLVTAVPGDKLLEEGEEGHAIEDLLEAEGESCAG